MHYLRNAPSLPRCNRGEKKVSRFGRALAITSLLASAFEGGGPLSATDLDVKPVRIALATPTAVGVVTLRNRGSEPLWIQTRITAWHQVDGRHENVDSSDLIVSPPMLELAPGFEHVIRIGLRTPSVRSMEATYRLFLEEVPRPGSTRAGLSIRLRLALPVFVAPEQSLPLPLEGQLVLGDDGLRLRLQNLGNLHVLVKKAHLYEVESGHEVARVASPGYLLARQTAVFPLERPPEGVELGRERPLRLQAVILTDRGRETQNLFLP